MLKNLSLNQQRIAIFIISAILFTPFIGNMHLFDWDEINFAECAREMILTKNYSLVQIDFQPFWEKPPLFIWFQVLSMKIFGINEFAARFPNVVCGIFTLFLIFEIGRKQFDNKFAWFWVLAWIGSILPFFYFKSGIIDPWFNLFIFGGIYFIFLFAENHNISKKIVFLIISAICAGLGVLTKGPVALLVTGLTVFFFGLVNIRRKEFRKEIFVFKRILGYGILYLLVFCLIGGAWFIWQILHGNTQLVVDFIVYQIRLFTTKDAGHGGFFLYHFVVLFFLVFPASIFAIPCLYKNFGKNASQINFIKWMQVLFWVVLILFTIVKTKIIHYSSLCYFPLTFLSAVGIYKKYSEQEMPSKWQKIVSVFIGGLILLILILFQFIVTYKSEIINSGLIKDKFAVGNLHAQVYWSGFEWIVGVMLFVPLVYFLYGKKINFTVKIIGIFTSVLVFTNLIVFFYLGKIEGYTQRTAIQFFKERVGENCYVQTYGYKSYGHLFYTGKLAPQNKLSLDKGWILTEKLDKPAYVICKNIASEEFEARFQNFKKIGEKNGFIFYYKPNN